MENYAAICNKIDYVLENFDKSTIKSTIDMLCSKGIAKGAYNSYPCLIALIDILSVIEEKAKARI